MVVRPPRCRATIVWRSCDVVRSWMKSYDIVVRLYHKYRTMSLDVAWRRTTSHDRWESQQVFEHDQKLPIHREIDPDDCDVVQRRTITHDLPPMVHDHPEVTNRRWSCDVLMADVTTTSYKIQNLTHNHRTTSTRRRTIIAHHCGTSCDVFNLHVRSRSTTSCDLVRPSKITLRYPTMLEMVARFL